MTAKHLRHRVGDIAPKTILQNMMHDFLSDMHTKRDAPTSRSRHIHRQKIIGHNAVYAIMFIAKSHWPLMAKVMQKKPSPEIDFLLRYSSTMLEEALSDYQYKYQSSDNHRTEDLHAIVLNNLAIASEYNAVLVEAINKLNSNGILVMAVLGDGSCIGLRELLAHTNIRFRPLVDIKTIGNMATAIGLAEVICDSDKVIIRYQDIHNLFEDLQALGCIESEHESHSLEDIARTTQLYTADQVIEIEFEIIKVIGQKKA